MDSRTVLALMLGSDKQYWQVHSCGDTDNPDIAIARVIAEKLRIQHQIQYYNLGKSDTVESITKSLRDYSLHTEMSDSPFGYPRLDLFSKMNREGYWMVDGGYGELLRRSYGNKLLLSNKEAIRTKDISILMQHLILPKSQIFSREVQQKLFQASMDQLQKAIGQMPQLSSREDIGNWIDLLHIRYRLRNYAGASQSIYDHYIPNYMPFALSLMISFYLTLTARERSNNRLNRRIIRSGNKYLREIPLVSSGTQVPYWTSSNLLVSRVWGKTRRMLTLTKAHHDQPFSVKALLQIKEFIIDRSRSADVKAYPFYDYGSLLKHVESFYKTTNEKDAQFIEDWLTFDFWRERVTADEYRV